MVSSLENWDGSLSSAVKQNGSRMSDLEKSAGASTSYNATTVQDGGRNTFGNGHGWHDTMASLDVNYMVRFLFDGNVLWLRSRSI